LTLKVIRLEAKVQEQETILNFLLQANEVPISPNGSKSIAENYRQNVIQSSGKSGKSGIPRTCRELRAANPSLASGMQWIDPDAKELAMIQFSFIATCHQVNFVIFIHFFFKFN
jgi:hypothetical protein